MIKKEHSRTTPDNIPAPPWQNPKNPDAYTNNHTKPPQQQLPLNEILARAHYTMACQRTPTGKAPGPDTIPNEVIKFLPEKTHDVIYSLFTIMAKNSYIPQKWCTSATKLIYKPNTKDPNPRQPGELPPHCPDELHPQTRDINPHHHRRPNSGNRRDI